MTTTLRLFRIEVRRNPAIWLVPVIVAVSWWMLGFQSWVDFLWRSTNELLQTSTVQFAAPAMAGAAAWVASRNRRRGVEDLLATTASPPVRRHLVLWAATSAWGLLAYSLFAAYMLGVTASQATAGTVSLLPIATVVAAILAHTSWGLLIGTLIPSRFTAPVVAIAALGIQQFVASQQVEFSGGFSSTWMNRLAAHNGWTWWTAALYASLTVAALVAIWMHERRDLWRAAILVTALAIAACSVVMIWGTYPHLYSPVDGRSGPPLNNFGREMVIPNYTPFPEVCEGSPVTVCVSLDLKPILSQGVRDANELTAPLLGLPDVPLQVDQQRASYSFGPGRNTRFVVDSYADDLVAERETLVDGNLANDAQIAIRDWLLLRSGTAYIEPCDYIYQPSPSMMFNAGWSTEQTCAATERFSALSAEEQRAWLEEHYTALRAGDLTLDDLP